MNNVQCNKKKGMILLQKLQTLSQNNEITPKTRATMASYIQEGMATGDFYKLNGEMYNLLETTKLPQIVEEMIKIAN